MNLGRHRRKGSLLARGCICGNLIKSASNDSNSRPGSDVHETEGCHSEATSDELEFDFGKFDHGFHVFALSSGAGFVGSKVTLGRQDIKGFWLVWVCQKGAP